MLIEQMFLAAAGSAASGGEASDFFLYAWGNNGDKHLGVSNVIQGALSWTMLVGGSQTQRWGIASGRLFAWGGQEDIIILGLNDNSFIRYSAPQQIGTSSWIVVAGGYRQALGIRQDGALFTWGSSSYGGFGLNESGFITRSSPVQIGTSSWIAVASDHQGQRVWAVRSDKKLFSWGRNDLYGVLGLNDTISRSSPTQVGTSNWSILADVTTTDKNGVAMSAIREDGALFVWGRQSYGQIGLNNSDGNANISSPTQLGTSSWTAVKRGLFDMMALRQDGALFSVGRNQQGQLGLNDQVSRSSPVQVGTSSWTSLGFAVNDGRAIRQDGALFTWGYSYYGEHGTGGTFFFRSSPIQVGTSSWILTGGAGAGIRTTGFAINTNYELYTFGTNNYGQLGDGTNTHRLSPVLVNILNPNSISPTALGTDRWVEVHSGEGGPNRNPSHFAITEDRRLFAWGTNTNGRLGLSDTTNRSIPAQVSGSWLAVASGYGASIGIKINGSLWGWGNAGYGDIGLNATLETFYSSPTQIGTSSWTAVTKGDGHTVAIRQDGALFAWGINQSFQLGIPDGTDKSSPTQIGTSSWIAVAAGRSTTAAIRSDGYLFMWGSNDSGVAAQETQFPAYSTHAISGYNNLAIRQDGTLWAWGLNSTVRPLGLNDSSIKSTPTQIGTSSWIVVSQGHLGSAAIRSGGALFTWGWNNFGQVGLNDLVHRSSPVQVGTSSWTAVDVGESTTAAIRQDGALFTWGFGQLGALGLNNIVHRSSPVQVGTSSWIAVSGLYAHHLAIRQDGGLFVWGDNRFGALGLTDFTSTSSPVQLGTSSWIAVSAGARFSMAIRQDNALFAWGENGAGWIGWGNLGLGDWLTVLSPTQVGTSSWTAVTASGGNISRYSMHTRALRSDGALFAWGAQTYGHFGNGSGSTGASSPVQIGLSSWTSIGRKPRTHSSAIRQDGALFVAGRQGNRLGFPTIVNDWTGISVLTGVGTIIPAVSSPVQIGASPYNLVSVGGLHTLASRENGELFAWGNNTSGQLGLNTVVDDIRSIQSLGILNPIKLSAGRSHSAMIDSSNQLFMWGQNSSGQLGLGDSANRSSPTQIGGTWNYVEAGLNKTFGGKTE
jgi:alpha-tubulin suppressor-like RCC1 family protein